MENQKNIKLQVSGKLAENLEKNRDKTDYETMTKARDWRNHKTRDRDGYTQKQKEIEPLKAC